MGVITISGGLSDGVEGLTVSAAMFLLLVAVPGYLGAWSAGRHEEARKYFAETLYRGAMSFGVCLLLLLTIPFFSQDYGKPLLKVFGGNADEVTRLRMAVWIGFFWGFAVFTGVLQLVIDLRLCRAVRISPAWRSFLASEQPLETSARSDILWEIFLCYRVCKKRPLVQVEMQDKEKPVQGEVLKASWGLKSGLLLCHIDRPGELMWVPLEKIVAVKFTNPGVLQDNPFCETKRLLNIIHPGFGDETEEKLKK